MPSTPRGSVDSSTEKSSKKSPPTKPSTTQGDKSSKESFQNPRPASSGDESPVDEPPDAQTQVLRGLPPVVPAAPQASQLSVHSQDSGSVSTPARQLSRAQKLLRDRRPQAQGTQTTQSLESPVKPAQGSSLVRQPSVLAPQQNRQQQQQQQQQNGNADTRSGGSKAETSQNLPDFDWDQFQARYEKAIIEADGNEKQLFEEFEQLVEYFNVWVSAPPRHDNERAVKRLQTRMRHVNLSEQKLDQKKAHLTEVVKAFQSALALLSTA